MTNDQPSNVDGSGASHGSIDIRFNDTTFFRQIVERTTYGIFSVDASKSIVFSNAAVEDVIGYSPADLLGRTLSTLIPEQFSHYHAAVELLLRADTELNVDAIELPVIHGEGHVCWITVSFSRHVHDGRRVFTGIIRDITERKEREEELERYERIIETIDDGVYILDSNFTITNVNDAVLSMTEYERDELIDSHASLLASDSVLEEAAELSDELLHSRQNAATLTGEITTKGGNRIPIETRFSLYPFDDQSYGQVGVVRDITERKQYEETLTALHDSTRELLGIGTKPDVCRHLVETATDVIQLSKAIIYLFDDEWNVLRPIAISNGSSKHPEELPSVGPNGDDVWRSFVEDEWIYVGNEDEAKDDSGDLFNNCACVPLGEHGVFLAATTNQDVFDGDIKTLVGLLAASAEAALSRVERGIEIRDREEELRQQNRQLLRLDEINSIIRGIDQSLVRAKTREEIGTAVCERLVASDRYVFAWIGEPDLTTGALRPQAWAGEERGYLSDVSFVVNSQEPTAKAATLRKAVVVSNVSAEFRSSPWRKEALSRNYGSVVSVPLFHCDILYGVLSVYANRSTAFDTMTQTVFGELGETISNAMHAIETKHALLTDDRVELEFHLRGSDDDLIRLTKAAGCETAFVGFVPQGGESIRVFFTAHGTDPERFHAIQDRLVTIESLRLIADRGDSHLFEAVIGRETIASAIANYGATIREITADDDELWVVVDIPNDANVRRFVELVASRYETSELVARRTRKRGKQPTMAICSEVEDRLTERQLEVLKVAYFSGFFEWPRESTGEEIAESLGISQPTVNRHLRACERKLFTMLLNEK